MGTPTSGQSDVQIKTTVVGISRWGGSLADGDPSLSLGTLCQNLIALEDAQQGSAGPEQTLCVMVARNPATLGYHRPGL